MVSALRHFVCSPRPWMRVARHVLFWVVFGFGFFIQSLMPVDDAARTAAVSLLCFFPSCILCAYVLGYFFVPRLLEHRRYALLAVAFVALGVVCLVLNYYTAILFYTLTCHCADAVVPAYAAIGLGFVNTTHALTIGGLVFGIKVGKDWQRKQKETLALSQQKIRHELQFQKSLIHPQFLFNSLHTLEARISAGSKESPELLLKLSDLLSYTLYEGSESRVVLERELAMLQTFIDLEGISRAQAFEAFLTVAADAPGKTIVPLVLLSALQGCLEADGRDTRVRYAMAIHTTAAGDELLFTIVCEHLRRAGDARAWEEVVQAARDRMMVFPADAFALRFDHGERAVLLSAALAQVADPTAGDTLQNQGRVS